MYENTIQFFSYLSTYFPCVLCISAFIERVAFLHSCMLHYKLHFTHTSRFPIYCTFHLLSCTTKERQTREVACPLTSDRPHCCYKSYHSPDCKKSWLCAIRVWSYEIMKLRCQHGPWIASLYISRDHLSKCRNKLYTHVFIHLCPS